MSGIFKHFKRISDDRYKLQNESIFLQMREKAAQEEEQKAKKREENHILAKEIRKRYDHERYESRKKQPKLGDANITVEDVVRNAIDKDIVPMLAVQPAPNETNADLSKRKGWERRPEDWITVTQHFISHGYHSTAVNFPQWRSGYKTEQSAESTLRRWRAQYQKLKENPALLHAQTQKLKGRLPAIGLDADKAVYHECERRISLGLTIDDFTLRQLVELELKNRNKLHLLQKNGGKLTIGHAWCIRFFKRHNLVTRVATTKMRERPADFDKKVEEYIEIGAAIMAKHNVPPELVVNGDETNVLFVPRASRTRTKKGAKRVRVIGVGHEKAQITCTMLYKSLVQH